MQLVERRPEHEIYKEVEMAAAPINLIRRPVDPSRYLTEQMTILERPKPLRNSSTSPHSRQTITEDGDQTLPTGMSQPPGREIKRKSQPGTVFVLAKENYKVNDDVVLSICPTSRILAVLGIGIGSSFIRKDMSPTQSSKNIRPLKVKARISDAESRTINTIEISMKLWNRELKLR